MKSTTRLSPLTFVTTIGSTLFLTCGCATSKSYSRADLLELSRSPVPPMRSTHRSPAATNPTFNGVDLSALVEFAKQHTFKLTKPVVMYNWAYRVDLQNEKSFEGKESLQYATSFSQLYWSAQYSRPDSHNNFAIAATRGPIPSRVAGYGNGGDNADQKNDWVLSEVILPEGLAIFDWREYREDRNSTESQAIVKSLLDLGCSAEYLHDKGGFSEFLMAPKHDSKKTCVDALSEVFQKSTLSKLSPMTFRQPILLLANHPLKNSTNGTGRPS